MVKKITAAADLVVLHGDEMAQVAFAEILNRFIRKRTGITLHEVDLSAKNRLKTNGKIVKEAIDLLVKYEVGVKNAGITVNKSQLAGFINELHQEGIVVEEAKLNVLATKSPNGAIRKGIGGNILREDIPFTNICRVFPEWKKRDIDVVTMEEGGLKDSYNGQADRSGKLTLRFTSSTGKSEELHTRSIEKNDIYLLATASITKTKAWAKNFFERALDENRPAYIALKDTVMPGYDGVIKEAVEEIFNAHYAAAFNTKKLIYQYGLIDAQAASMVVSPPQKALWGIPDNTVGNKMLALVNALKRSGLPSENASLAVSRMSAGGGDQYGSFNAPAQAEGTITLAIDDTVLHMRPVKKGDPILLMTNCPADIKAWARQTFQEAARKGQEIYFGMDSEVLHYDAIAEEMIREASREWVTEGQALPAFNVVTPAQQVVKMVCNPVPNGCYASLNMDGDIFSDIAAALGGSLATASSVIASPDGKIVFEAPHGTAPDLYKSYCESKGRNAFFNPSALIYAVANAIEVLAAKQRGHAGAELLFYARSLKEALVQTVAQGYITPDIKGQTLEPKRETVLDLFGFLDKVEGNLPD